MKTDNTELFRSTPVPRAVLSLVVPMVISQLITVIYNMADTLPESGRGGSLARLNFTFSLAGTPPSFS